MLMRTMALYMAGTILSQLPMPIHASQGCAPMMVSIWSAISSREGREYFIPKWPMAMPSHTAPPMLVYQTLKPSASNSCFTTAPRRSRWAWPGIWVVWEFTMVTKGRFSSSMERITPSALIREAAGVMWAPSVRMRLPRLRMFSIPEFIGRHYCTRAGRIFPDRSYVESYVAPGGRIAHSTMKNSGVVHSMKFGKAASLLTIAASSVLAAPVPVSTRPQAGPVEIMRSSDLRPGMKGTAWTVFAGKEPEPVPIEVVGLWKNAWGPKQDIILAKMGGKALRTNVAGGMSGSPVYIDGKLVGAVALRLSVFSPDAICGITPIELMLEINDFDKTRPSDARTPDKAASARQAASVPGELLAQAVAAGASPNLPSEFPTMVPIETPLTFSGFSDETLREFGPMFRQLGITVAQGGAGSAIYTTKPAAGWHSATRSSISAR